MKQFIYKLIVSVIAIVLVYEFTVGKLIKKYSDKLNFISTKDGRKELIISLREEIQSVNFPGRLLTYLNSGLPVILLSNKKNELTKFVINKKIGVVITSKENIFTKLKHLKKIKNDFIKSKTNIIVLKKYFNLKINAKKIFN